MSNGVKVVCSSRHTPRLQKLQKLSLYDNMLSSVKVISALNVFCMHSKGAGLFCERLR